MAAGRPPDGRFIKSIPRIAFHCIRATLDPLALPQVIRVELLRAVFCSEVAHDGVRFAHHEAVVDDGGHLSHGFELEELRRLVGRKPRP
jgi:hypothetical protein